MVVSVRNLWKAHLKPTPFDMDNCAEKKKEVETNADAVKDEMFTRIRP